MQMFFKNNLLIFLVSINFMLIDTVLVGMSAEDKQKLSKTAKLGKVKAGLKSAAKSAAKPFTSAKESAKESVATFKGTSISEGIKEGVKGAAKAMDPKSLAKTVTEGVKGVGKAKGALGALSSKEAPKKDAPKAPEKGAPGEVEAEKKAAPTPGEAVAEKDVAKKEAEKKASDKKMVEEFMRKQEELSGKAEDPMDKGFWDKVFWNIGAFIAKRYPDKSVALMKRALECNQKFKDSPTGRYAEDLKEDARRLKEKYTPTVFQQSKVGETVSREEIKARMADPKEGSATRKEVLYGSYESERNTPERQKHAQRLMAEGKTAEEVEKVIKDEIEKTVGVDKLYGIYPSERSKPEWEKRAKELEAQGKTPEEAERVIKEEIEKATAAEVDKAAESILKDKITEEKVNAKVEKRIAEEGDRRIAEIEKILRKDKNLVVRRLKSVADWAFVRGKADERAKYKSMLQKLAAKREGEEALSKAEFKALMQDPNVRRELIEAAIKEEIKDDLKLSWYGKTKALSDKLRQKSASVQAMMWSVMLQSLMSGISVLISKVVANATSRQVALAGGVQAKKIIEAESTYGSDELTPEDQKNMDAIDKLAVFYSNFDEKFKSVLNELTYNSRTFQTTEKLNFAGGTLTAGISVLFDYQGAGDVSQGLTPVFVRFYPLEIMGNPIDPMQVLVGVSDIESLELIAFLRAVSPDVIFFIKVISLFNTANKKYSDLVQRDAFFTEQINLLFMRFLRTVDDVATRRANIIEKDPEKWDSVYMKKPAKCFQSAPKALRNFLADLSVDTFDKDGKKIKISFEQYIVNKFEAFDDVLDIQFEGDVDFEVEVRELDDAQVRVQLLAIFMRALSDVLRIEKELVETSDSVTIIDAKDKPQKFDSKKFYITSTQVAFDQLQKVQVEFVDATIDYAADLTDATVVKRYNAVFNEYLKTLAAYSKSTLEFRKKTCFYPFEKTLGYEPERVFDFVKRECKRTYQESKNKAFFISVLPKVFEPFAGNFPFSDQDILQYSQEPGPVKSPVKILGAGVSR